MLKSRITLHIPRCGTNANGLWRSLASAFDWGSKGRRFKSCQPDSIFLEQTPGTNIFFKWPSANSLANRWNKLFSEGWTKVNSEEKNNDDGKALVMVFEDFDTAAAAVHALNDGNFPTDRVELVTHDFDQETHDVKTPAVHETSTSSTVSQGEKWAAVGGGVGAVGAIIAAVLTPFPGVGLAMIVVGGVAGGLYGAVAGLEHAGEDDAVDLPTPDDYQELVKQGHKLVVVHGTHDEMMQARDLIEHLPSIHRHLHPIRGREFHEHPEHLGNE